MGMFSSFNINASGLTAQRLRMDTISENVANANTTRTEDGPPYVRKIVTFATKGAERPLTAGTFHKVLKGATAAYVGQGVKVNGIYEDKETEGNLVYDPSHPDADENGYVLYPNVNIITEMTNLIDASRAYEANATAFNASKSIAQQGLQIGQQS